MNVKNGKEYLFTYERIYYDLSVKLNDNISKIVEWGPLKYTTKIKAHIYAEINEHLIKIVIFQPKGVIDIPFPDSVSKGRIEKSINNFDIQQYTQFLLDSEYEIFAARMDALFPWMFMGEENPQVWEDLNFLAISNWTTDPKLLHNPILWKVGNNIFQSSPSYIDRPLSAVVLGDYCDRFVPKNDGEVQKVSLEGFITLLYYLKSLTKSNSIFSTHQCKTLYEEYDKTNAIPLIPVTWRGSDIEKLNLVRLRSILKNINDKLDKEDETKEVAKKTPSIPGTNSLTKPLDSGDKKIANDIIKNIDNASKILDERVKLTDKGINKANLFENEVLKLSNILATKFSTPMLDVYGGEYLVDIDTGITEGGISISQSEMLVAIVSFGLLEILVEEDVLKGMLKELENSIEKTYGIGVKFYDMTQVGGREIIKRGGKINARS